MNLITVPNLNRPISTSMQPAMKVAMASPERPYIWMMLKIITINAPVGPPICTLLPPRADTMKPPMTAVTRPVVGPTPLAMANAIASGRATMPTTMPAVRSVR